MVTNPKGAYQRVTRTANPRPAKKASQKNLRERGSYPKRSGLNGPASNRHTLAKSVSLIITKFAKIRFPIGTAATQELRKYVQRKR